MDNKFLILASDGSAIKKPKVRGSKEDRWWCSGGYSGIVMDDKGTVTETLSEVIKLDDSTNNIGELTGLEMAVDKAIEMAAKSNLKVVFLLDSDYTLKSVTLWIHGWMKNIRDGIAYKADGQPVKNYEQIYRIYTKLSKLPSKAIFKIRSHVPKEDYEKRYTEFCEINNTTPTFRAWKLLNKLNNECDAIVNNAANELKEGIL